MYSFLHPILLYLNLNSSCYILFNDEVTYAVIKIPENMENSNSNITLNPIIFTYIDNVMDTHTKCSYAF